MDGCPRFAARGSPRGRGDRLRWDEMADQRPERVRRVDVDRAAVRRILAEPIDRDLRDDLDAMEAPVVPPTDDEREPSDS